MSWPETTQISTPPPRFTSFERAVMWAGAIAGLGVVVWGVHRSRKSTGPSFSPADCSQIGPGGGHLAGFRYVERVTPGADPEQPLPMIVMFHSRGSRPENHAGMFYKALGFPVRVLLPEGPHAIGSNRSWTTQPSRTKEQGAWADELEELGADLAQFIHDAVECRPTIGRPVVAGSSEGGHVAYLMATLYPGMIAGASPVAGYLPESLWDANMAPTIAFHGERDTAVPYARTERYWKTMEAEGAPISYQSFPDVGHSVPSSVGRAWRQALRELVQGS